MIIKTSKPVSIGFLSKYGSLKDCLKNLSAGIKQRIHYFERNKVSSTYF
jgi:hypothetical protein